MSSEAAAEADRRLENIIRVGRVISVQPGGGATATVSFGGDLESPALAVAQMRAGALQFWWMPTVGRTGAGGLRGR